jgi:hypothetical protein
MDGGTTIHFVTAGIHAALARAREAAGGQDIRLGGGASTISQYLQAGLIDWRQDSPPSHWLDDPPPNEGRKVMISDTDHYSSTADTLWAWKSFLRGHPPILMDYGIITGVTPRDPSAGLPYAALEAARYATSNTLKYAKRIKLIDMEPRGKLSSTEYALANPGEEYLVLQPSASAEVFAGSLAAGSYAVEWQACQAEGGFTAKG